MGAPDGRRDLAVPGDDAGWHMAFAEWQRLARPWIEQAQSWGFPLDSPGLGATRESHERWRNAMAAWLDVTRARTEYGAVMVDAWRDVVEAATRECLNFSQAGLSAPHPRALFSQYVDLADRIFSEIFRSPRYIEAQRALLDAVAASRACEGELIEEMARVGHIATRRELDEVHSRIDELRREIRALRKAQNISASRSSA